VTRGPTPGARRRRPRWPWLVALAAVVSVVAAPVSTAAPGTGSSGTATPGTATAGIATSATGTAPELTTSKQISRTHLVDGRDDVVEQDTFKLSVSSTTDLRSHQTIDVSWSGAHPTGGILLDPNSGSSTQEEYPVVLLECAGVDSDSAPAAQRLSPETCWTATPNERFQNSGAGDAFPPYRVDRYAAAADRQAIVGEPQPRPPECGGRGVTERWVHFRTLAGADYPNGPVLGCGGMAPEAVSVGDTLAFPSNTTYATTDLDGTGESKFDVWTADENASLGCGQDTPCALVAVPILGISCDVDAASLPAEDRPAAGAEADAASTACEATGQFAPGQRTFVGRSFDLSVSGALWWSASNWRNRVTVPLQFAPPSDVCGIVGGSGDGIELYGSELATQATAQWSPHFCLDPKLFKLRHVQTPEPQARAALADGSVQGILSSAVPDGGFATPTVNAPVALTGFAVSFTIDDGNKQQLHHLRLTPRLLAKLLTASYPAVLTVQSQEPALARNPLDITTDPEFQALNPDAPKDIGNSVSASTLVALSSDSDVMSALTSYIEADPEARSFLDGTPDPWGMTVNPAYKGIALPTIGWPLLDTFVPTFTETANACLYHDPVPFSPLVAAPMSRLFQISQSLQFAIANSTTTCYQPIEGDFTQISLKPIGREYPGFRFLIGITSLADAYRYGLDTAELQTRSTQPTDRTFTNADGRTFVAPDDDGLRAAAATLRPDADTHTWQLGSTTSDDPSTAGAYPGTMPVYAQVPTTGLPKDQAKEFATFLRFAASDGQVVGHGNGQLPPGYLPLTAGNGLAELAAYTNRAADAVQAQDGTVPDVGPAAKDPAPSDGSVDGGGAPPASVSDLWGDVEPEYDASSDAQGWDPLEEQSSSAAPVKRRPAAPRTVRSRAVVATLSYASGLVGRLLPWLVIGAFVSGAVAGAAFALARFGPRRFRP
jgi:hypothetical protein